MRVLLLPTAILVVAQVPAGSQQPEPGISTGELVRQVVYNELHDHRQHGYWRYWIERHSGSETLREQQVETAEGPVTVAVASEGHALDAQDREQQQEQLNQLLSSPQEQARHLRQYRHDEDRIAQILALLPDAFLFDFDGMEDGCYRLRFHPNRAYATRAIEGRILHAMSGTLWIDARYKHLARLDGHIDHNVDFGFGILGRLYEGGWFQLRRVRVSDTDWKTSRLEVHMDIRALLVTNIARETSEMRGGFTAVPAGLSLAQGVALIEQTAPPQSAAAPTVAAAKFNVGR